MFLKQLSRALISALLLTIFCGPALAQGFKQELEAPEKIELTVRNLDGRVSVVASEEQQKKVTVEAKSSGDAIDPSDVRDLVGNPNNWFVTDKALVLLFASGVLAPATTDFARKNEGFSVAAFALESLAEDFLAILPV